MNRIDVKFRALRTAGQKGFIAYICAGDPNLRVTAELVRAFEREGVDVVELGVPFSDPLADGVVNQLAAERALRSGTTLRGVLKTVATLRHGGLRVPIVFYVYYNVLHHYGLKKFVRDAAGAGVDGVLALDLPPEEAGAYERAMKQAGLYPIYLIAPTTPATRVHKRLPRRGHGHAEKTGPGGDGERGDDPKEFQAAGGDWLWDFKSIASSGGSTGGGRGGCGKRDCEPNCEAWQRPGNRVKSGAFRRSDGASCKKGKMR